MKIDVKTCKHALGHRQRSGACGARGCENHVTFDPRSGGRHRSHCPRRLSGADAGNGRCRRRLSAEFADNYPRRSQKDAHWWARLRRTPNLDSSLTTKGISRKSAGPWPQPVFSHVGWVRLPHDIRQQDECRRFAGIVGVACRYRDGRSLGFLWFGRCCWRGELHPGYEFHRPAKVWRRPASTDARRRR